MKTAIIIFQVTLIVSALIHLVFSILAAKREAYNKVTASFLVGAKPKNNKIFMRIVTWSFIVGCLSLLVLLILLAIVYVF